MRMAMSVSAMPMPVSAAARIRVQFFLGCLEQLFLHIVHEIEAQRRRLATRPHPLAFGQKLDGPRIGLQRVERIGHKGDLLHEIVHRQRARIRRCSRGKSGAAWPCDIGARACRRPRAQKDRTRVFDAAYQLDGSGHGQLEARRGDLVHHVVGLRHRTARDSHDTFERSGCLGRLGVFRREIL